MQENAKSAKLAALFNTLEEDDKDIVLTITESLVEKHRENADKKIDKNIEKISNHERRAT